MAENTNIALASILNNGVEQELASLYSQASQSEREALLRAFKQVHEAGQAEAEKRTGRIIASVLAPLLGVPQPDSTSQGRSRIRGVLSAMRNLTV